MSDLSRDQQLIAAALPTYEVGHELGRGAFGVVYAGRHRTLGREVAIKQLPRAFAADPGVRNRFVAEAQVVARLEHPHIVPVYDFVEREDGLCLLVMERCHASLADRFHGEGLATDESIAAVLACLAGLEHAHLAQVLHRDIKPENLLLDEKGTVKLADFGVARVMDSATRHTATGVVIGTPVYMSPEQAAGETLGPPADIYSVGIMAYELLSGTLPFKETDSIAAMIRHHLSTPPTPLAAKRPELHPAIGAAVDRALAKSTDDRYATAEEFGLALAAGATAAFGAGWMRRRRFVLHWPAVYAETERPPADGVRTGTIIVSAPPGQPPVARPAVSGETIAATPPPFPAAPPPAPPAPSAPAAAPPTTATPPPWPTPAPPSSPAAPPAAPGVPAGAQGLFGSAPGTGGPPTSFHPSPPPPRNRTPLYLGIAAVVVAFAVGALLALSGGDDGGAGPDPTATVAPEPETATPTPEAPTATPAPETPACDVAIVLPSDWRTVDLVDETPADAALRLRPAASDAFGQLLQDLVDQGGVLYGEGPVEDEFLVNMNIVRLEGSFTPDQSPDDVQTGLNQLGLIFEGERSIEAIGGSTINTQIVAGDEFDLTQYVLPRDGAVLVASFASPDAARWDGRFDLYASTISGCP